MMIVMIHANLSLQSHAVLLLLDHGHTVTVLDNLSRGNGGAIAKLSVLHPTSKLRFLKSDLGDQEAVFAAFTTARPPIDIVMHFAAIAYVGQ